MTKYNKTSRAYIATEQETIFLQDTCLSIIDDSTIDLIVFSTS